MYDFSEDSVLLCLASEHYDTDNTSRILMSIQGLQMEKNRMRRDKNIMDNVDNNQKRLGNIDVWRFIASLLIMACHLDSIGVGQYRWVDAWIFVEFFFILSGYFTMKQLETKDTVCFDKAVQLAFSNGKKRYKKFLPHLLITVFIAYLIKFIRKEIGISHCFYYLFDVFLLTGWMKNRMPVIEAYWFLSVMLIACPLFQMICSILPDNVLLVISLYFPLSFYGWCSSINGYVQFPMSIARSFAAFSLGIFIYFILVYFSNIKCSKYMTVILSIIEITTMSCVLLFTFFRLLDYRIWIFCICVSIMLMLSGKTATSKLVFMGGYWEILAC